MTDYETEDETWTMVGDPSNYLPGEDGILRIPHTWRIDGAANLGSFTAIDGGFTNENCGDPLPIESDGEGGGTSTFPITAAEDGKTDKKMYVVMKKALAKSSKKKMQAEHADPDHPKRKQLIANIARHTNKRPPSRTGKHERLCTHIQLAEGERGIAVCGSKARNANPKLWDARLKLWEWEQKNNWQEEAFYPGEDTPKNPYRCFCGIVTVSNRDDGFQICEESWMWCSQCDSACD